MAEGSVGEQNGQIHDVLFSEVHLCTATLTHRMSVLCMGHCGGKMIFRIHKILADSPKFKE